MSLATPMLGARTGALTITGRVERAEPRLPKGYRLTLRVFSIDGLGEKTAPAKVRITSRAELEPVMPDGFDFARKAWFAGIGAVGFSLAAAEPMDTAPEPGALLMRIKAVIQRLRQHVDTRIRQAVPGENGAIASPL